MSQQIRAAITREASEWLVANRAESPGPGRGADFSSWLRISPVHVEEYLAVAQTVQDLQLARDPRYSLEDLVRQATLQEDSAVESIGGPEASYASGARSRAWPIATAASVLLAVLAVLAVRSGSHPATSERFATSRGQQQAYRLADNSIIHLNTDTAVVVEYSPGERRVSIERGQAMFEVAHDEARPFLVRAGGVDVRDIGTAFDVYRHGSGTLVTVLRGQVAVSPNRKTAGDASPPWSVRVPAGQQVEVTGEAMPANPTPADASRSTAWLRRQIAFEQEPLAQVAAEFNRYTKTPIQIEGAALRELRISGVFAIDDTQAFIAFLRTLKGVRVEVSSTSVRVFKQ